MNNPPAPTQTVEIAAEYPEHEAIPANNNKLEGTFQFQINKENYSLILTDELINKIKTSRKDSENVTIQIDEFVSLFIPSYSQINSSEFKSLDSVITL